MNLFLLITLFTVSGVLIELFASLFEERKKLKKFLIIFGALIALIAAGFGYKQKVNDDLSQEVKSKRQDSLNTELRDSLYKSISFQRLIGKENDSLRIAINILNQQNNRLIRETGEFRKDELEHFIKNQISISDVSNKFGQRHLNQGLEKALTDNLKSNKGTLTLGLYSGSQEAKSFHDEIARAFKNAGWEVSIGNQGMDGGSTDVTIAVNPDDSTSVYAANVFYQIMVYAGYKTYFTKRSLFSSNVPRKSKKSRPTLEIKVSTYTQKKE